MCVGLLKFTIHYSLHLVFPLIIALIFYKDKPWKAYLVFIAAMLIDVDHLLANPVFDACRCSIGFHPMHSWYALVVYAGLFLFKKTRIISIGLLIHLFADFIDCLFIG